MNKSTCAVNKWLNNCTKEKEVIFPSGNGLVTNKYGKVKNLNGSACIMMIRRIIGYDSD